MSTEHISAGVDIENFSSRDAMILINGKPEVGTVAFPQSGSCINEEQMLDESFTDQICGIFKYLNNIILVTNQHGTLLNQILKREREEERPNEILRELEGLGHLGELSNQKLEAIMSSARENKANEAYEGKAGNSIKALKGTLHGLYYANDSLFQSNEAVLTKTEEMLKRLRLLEEKKASIDQVEQIKNETLTRCEKDIGNTSNDITEKISLLDKEIDRKINESMARMGEIEKETVWKIKDCEELLKARATEKYVSGIFELAEKNTQLKVSSYLIQDGRYREED